MLQIGTIYLRNAVIHAHCADVGAADGRVVACLTNQTVQIERFCSIIDTTNRLHPRTLDERGVDSRAEHRNRRKFRKGA